jgi:hypothetical protein
MRSCVAVAMTYVARNPPGSASANSKAATLFTGGESHLHRIIEFSGFLPFLCDQFFSDDQRFNFGTLFTPTTLSLGIGHRVLAIGGRPFS